MKDATMQDYSLCFDHYFKRQIKSNVTALMMEIVDCIIFRHG